MKNQTNSMSDNNNNDLIFFLKRLSRIQGCFTK